MMINTIRSRTEAKLKVDTALRIVEFGIVLNQLEIN